MERIDWNLLVSRMATVVEEIQSNHHHHGRPGGGGGGWTSFLSGNSVWELLIGTGRDTERINQLTLMVRLASQLALLDEIDAALDKQFPILEQPLSEITLRLRIGRAALPEICNNPESDLSVEMMADAIDCILSRLKRRVTRAAFSDIYAPSPLTPIASADTIVVSSGQPKSPNSTAAPVTTATTESTVVEIPASETSPGTTLDNAEEIPSNNECIIA